jgi:hypothetical protein
MIYIWENILPIMAATLAGMLLGFLWYGVLGRPWRQAAGFNVENARRYTKTALPIAFIAEFWMASILAGALILAPVEAGRWTIAFGTAFIIWIGFVLPAIVTTYRLAGRSWTLCAIDGGHWLFVMLIHAAVLRAIGVEAPSA